VSDAAPFADARVLVVDDNEANVMLLERMLAAAGVTQVHTTTDPRAAIDVYKALAPDLVLLDLHMPGMDGLAVMTELDRIRSSDEFVPVIVLTADSTPAVRESVLTAGAHDFVTKPFDRTEVVLRARNLLLTRALHTRLRAHNAALQIEIERRNAAEARARHEYAVKRERIRRVLDSDALRMVFQPITDLTTREFVGCEALARFDLDGRRPVHEWFAEADEVGLCNELELAAVHKALKELETLPQGWFMTINLSPATAVTPALERLLDYYPGDRVIVEITEHARIDDYERLLAALARLRERGMRLAVDDAGAGFASLSHILTLRPDIIKLDITLTRDIDSDPVKRALAGSLVAFGREIGSTIIAEGIETEREDATLTTLGVPLGQGYFLARPDTLASHLARNSTVDVER
jgi:EAL domain-containing protein (putative c-di-GMP-specific phosphodiesterase class I)/AmiR/NasT family two-component response regulator